MGLGLRQRGCHAARVAMLLLVAAVALGHDDDDQEPVAWHVPVALAGPVNAAAGFLTRRGLLTRARMPLLCASCMQDPTACADSLCSNRTGITCATYSCSWPVKGENGSDASPRICSSVYYNDAASVMVGCNPPADASASDACPQEWLPVCGSDKTTYPNSCLASLAEAQPLHSGYCNGSTVLTPAGSSQNITTNVTTIAVASGCPSQLDLVCGSDNVTYNSSCWARSVGVTDFTAGACSPSITAAGCSSGNDPVCGPGNATYNTSCTARQWGISNFTTGACTAASGAPEVGIPFTALVLALLVTVGLWGR